MVEINNLSFSYGKTTVLENISLNLESGKIYGLLGENGVGKTTLLTLLCGLKKANAGRILIDGRNPYNREVDFLQSQYYLPDEVMPYNMTAKSFANNYGRFWPSFSFEIFERIMGEFETDIEQKMNHMSCGQLKKTYISFALACRARYIYMDEPTNGLDIPSKTQFRKAITTYTSDESTVLISTHQVRDLENIIDPIIILDNSSILLNASLEDISQKLYFDYGSIINPASLYSEQLPGGFIQVIKNEEGLESKVNLEALFNAVTRNKTVIRNLFNQ